MAATKMSLKLLVDKRNQTVLFAEAGKDFVDFLFNCLALPVGIIISLLPKAGVAGSLRDLYASVEDLSDTYIERREKEALLNPKARSSGPNVLRSLLLKPPSSAPIDYYSCPGTASGGGFTFTSCGATGHPSSFPFGSASPSGFSRASCGTYVTDSPSTRCPCCNNTMSKKLSWVAGPAAGAASSAKVPSGEGGYVRGVVTYMVMDDLVVKPMSTISCITLLNRFHLREIGDLDEKVVDFGLEEVRPAKLATFDKYLDDIRYSTIKPEAIKLLNASLHSKTVLTDIFSGQEHQ